MARRRLPPIAPRRLDASGVYVGTTVAPWSAFTGVRTAAAESNSPWMTIVLLATDPPELATAAGFSPAGRARLIRLGGLAINRLDQPLEQVIRIAYGYIEQARAIRAI
jgi:hypothetical protein